MKCHDVQRMIQGFIEKRLTDEQLEAFWSILHPVVTVMMSWKSII